MDPLSTVDISPHPYDSDCWAIVVICPVRVVVTLLLCTERSSLNAETRSTSNPRCIGSAQLSSGAATT
jgi:hypothetical protein